MGFYFFEYQTFKNWFANYNEFKKSHALVQSKLLEKYIRSPTLKAPIMGYFQNEVFRLSAMNEAWDGSYFKNST